MKNPIKYIHPAAFRGLLVLEHLKLRHTHLQSLSLPLQDVGHSLTELDVSLSTHVKGNEVQTFTDLRKIKLLEMHHNGLRAIPLGLNLIASTVMTINFAHNSISSLTSMEGIEFNKLVRLRLSYNEITHLRPEFLITPHLQILNLVGNQLVSLAEVIQYSWGRSLPEHKYMGISLAKNRWHCNGSLIWTSSNLYRIGSEIIYAKPPFKPYIRFVDQLFCESPDARHGTTVVPIDVIESVNISIHLLRDLAGKCYYRFAQTQISTTWIIYELLTYQWLLLTSMSIPVMRPSSFHIGNSYGCKFPTLYCISPRYFSCIFISYIYNDLGNRWVHSVWTKTNNVTVG